MAKPARVCLWPSATRDENQHGQPAAWPRNIFPLLTIPRAIPKVRFTCRDTLADVGQDFFPRLLTDWQQSLLKA